MCVCVCLECCLSVSAFFFSNPFLHLEVVAPLVLASGSFVFFFFIPFATTQRAHLLWQPPFEKAAARKERPKSSEEKVIFFLSVLYPPLSSLKLSDHTAWIHKGISLFFLAPWCFLFCYFSNYGKYSSTKTWVILERDTSVIPVNVIFLLLPGCFECQKRGQHFFFLFSPQSDSSPHFFAPSSLEG